MYTLTIAVRSLGRNKRRMVITTLATALAGWIMLVYSALLDGMVRTMERTVVSLELGDLQIHAEGYRRDPDLYLRISRGEELADELSKRGLLSAPRLYTFALAASGVSSAGAELRGIDVEREARVSEIHKHVRHGSWLDTTDPRGIVLGAKLARSMNAKVGSEVVLLGQAADGSMANDLYQVRGVLKTISERADRSGLFLTEAAFRELMVLPEGHHELALARGKHDLNAAKSIASSEAKGAEVMTWRELQPAVAQMLDSSVAGRFILMFIMYGAISMVILNATLMSVFERIREFGVMKAIGVTPFQVGFVIFLEVMLQALAASAIALATGLPLAFYLQRHGWNLSSFAGDMSFAGIAMEPIWYAQVSVAGVATAIGALFAIVALASLYPGIKAAVIRPLEAIYHR
jgi:ABC-type lipoprotein release transport system permease subunit